MEYSELLKQKFSHLSIQLVRHDTSTTGCPVYVEVTLDKTPSKKEMGTLVLDLGNYLSRHGLRYQNPPEYVKESKKHMVRFYQSWEDFEPIRAAVLNSMGSGEFIRFERVLPDNFYRILIGHGGSGA